MRCYAVAPPRVPPGNRRSPFSAPPARSTPRRGRLRVLSWMAAMSSSSLSNSGARSGLSSSSFDSTASWSAVRIGRHFSARATMLVADRLEVFLDLRRVGGELRPAPRRWPPGRRTPSRRAAPQVGGEQLPALALGDAQLLVGGAELLVLRPRVGAELFLQRREGVLDRLVRRCRRPAASSPRRWRRGPP